MTKKILPRLPLFENMLAQLEGTQYFSDLDLTYKFYQIPTDPTDTSKTPFRTAFNLYEFYPSHGWHGFGRAKCPAACNQLLTW